MQTVWIDGRDYRSPRELHLALQRLLSLPSWYGLNADALNDCLSERDTPIALWIAHPGEGEVAQALARVKAVVEDLRGTVKELYH